MLGISKEQKRRGEAQVALSRQRFVYQRLSSNLHFLPISELCAFLFSISLFCIILPMARIHIDEDDSLPDLADLLKANKRSPRKNTQATPRQPAERSASNSRQHYTPKLPKPISRRTESENGKDEKNTKPRQRTLKKVENNARLASASKEKVRTTIGEGSVVQKPVPIRAPRTTARSRSPVLELSNDEDAENEGTKKGADTEYQTDSDNSLPSPRKLFSKPPLFASTFEAELTNRLNAQGLNLGKFISPLLLPKRTTKEEVRVRNIQVALPSTSRPTSSSDNDKSAFLI